MIKRFVRKRLYEVYDGDERIDCDVIDVLAKEYHTTQNCIRSCIWHKCKLAGLYTFKVTDKYVNYICLCENDLIPYRPRIKYHKEEEPTYEETMLMHLKMYGNFALGANEKNPARYLPMLYEKGFDCKINTYVDPSVGSMKRKAKEYYSIEVVNYV